MGPIDGRLNGINNQRYAGDTNSTYTPLLSLSQSTRTPTSVTTTKSYAKRPYGSSPCFSKKNLTRRSHRLTHDAAKMFYFSGLHCCSCCNSSTRQSATRSRFIACKLKHEVEPKAIAIRRQWTKPKVVTCMGKENRRESGVYAFALCNSCHTNHHRSMMRKPNKANTEAVPSRDVDYIK